MSKYLFLGKINQEYISGMLQNPDQDRTAVLKNLAAALGADFHSLEFTRGAYDVVCICDAPDFETALAMKTTVIRGGAVASIDILEVFDFNQYAHKAASVTSGYKAPTA